MNLVKNYFKMPQDISGVPENIVYSNRIQFNNITDTYDSSTILDMLSQFMEKVNEQYNVAQNIPSYIDRSQQFSAEAPYISETVPKKAITNKTRKKKINLEENKDITMEEDEDNDEDS